MREIVSLHVGQCGIQMGDAIYSLLARESGLDRSGVPEEANCVNNALWAETSNGTWSPRTIFIDSEPTVVDEVVLKSPIKPLYTREFLVKGKEEAYGCFAQAKFHTSRALLPQFVCAFRRLLEQCYAVNCLRLVHSICGGTGSGLATTILFIMDDVIPGIAKHLHTVIPSKQVEYSPTSVLNAVLALAQTEALHNIRFIYDNNSMTSRIEPLFKGKRSPTFADLNALPALVTSSLSIDSKVSMGEMDLIQLSNNLICFPHMKMVSAAYAPLLAKGSIINMTAFGVASEVFTKSYELCALDIDKGQYLASWLLFRGEFDPWDIHQAKGQILHPNASMDVQFKSWIPNFLKQGFIKNAEPKYIDEYLCRSKKTLLKVSNHTGIANITDDMLAKYEILMDSRAFTFWYVNAGMEEHEFSEALEIITGTQAEFRNLCSDSMKGQQ